MPNLQGKICLVTGAARGIGRGIALQLGGAGATVYITGRTESNLNDCAQEIINRGGKAVPVIMDHAVDSDVVGLFDRIKNEQNNQLDLLVNNAYAGVSLIDKSSGKKFWETDPIHTWDTINGVGLRNHYICTTLASRIMVEQKSGLIINISSFGGLKYLFNCAYGIGKAACDRMAADCAHELKKYNVTCISLWPGPVRTEYIQEHIMDKDGAFGGLNKAAKVFLKGETIEFAGKSIVHLAAYPNIIKKTGRILHTTDLACEYDFIDIDGVMPICTRKVKDLLDLEGWKTLAAWVPDFIKIPNWLLHLSANKF